MAATVAFQGVVASATSTPSPQPSAPTILPPSPSSFNSPKIPIQENLLGVVDSSIPNGTDRTEAPATKVALEIHITETDAGSHIADSASPVLCIDLSKHSETSCNTEDIPATVESGNAVDKKSNSQIPNLKEEHYESTHYESEEKLTEFPCSGDTAATENTNVINSVPVITTMPPEKHVSESLCMPQSSSLENDNLIAAPIVKTFDIQEKPLASSIPPINKNGCETTKTDLAPATDPLPCTHGNNTEWLGRLLAIAARAAIENNNGNHNMAPECRVSTSTSSSTLPSLTTTSANIPVRAGLETFSESSIRQGTPIPATSSSPGGKNIASNLSQQNLSVVDHLSSLNRREPVVLSGLSISAQKACDMPAALGRSGSLLRPPVGASSFDAAIFAASRSHVVSLDSLPHNSMLSRINEQLPQRVLQSSHTSSGITRETNVLHQTGASAPSGLQGVKRSYPQNFSQAASEHRSGKLAVLSTDSSVSECSPSKKRGVWCAAHVRIAWLIYRHQQQQNAVNDSTKPGQSSRPHNLANTATTLSLTESLNSASKRTIHRNDSVGRKPDNLIDSFLPSAFLSLSSPSSQKLPLQSGHFREPVVSSDGRGGLQGLAMPRLSTSISEITAVHRSSPVAGNANITSGTVAWGAPFGVHLNSGNPADRGPNSSSVIRTSDPLTVAARQLAGSSSNFLQLQQQLGVEAKRRQAEQLLAANENSAARAVQAFANSVESLMTNSSISNSPVVNTQSSHTPTHLMDMIRLFAPGSTGTIGDARPGGSGTFPHASLVPQTVPRQINSHSEQQSLIDTSLAPFLAAAALAASAPASRPAMPNFGNSYSAPHQFGSNATPEQNSAAAVQLQLSTLFGGFPVPRSSNGPTNVAVSWPSGNFSQIPSNSFMFPPMPRR